MRDPRSLIAEGRKALQGTTEGPWVVDYDPRRDPGPAHIIATDEDGHERQTVCFMTTSIDGDVADHDGDAELIVWARNNLPALCEALEEALLQVETLTEKAQCRHDDAMLVSRLAAETPQFSNPLDVFAAHATRDDYLTGVKVRP